MIGAWSVEALRRPAPDVVVVGSDPVLAASVALPWKRLVPRTRIAHWCFDLYPEAAFEEGLLRRDGLAGRALLRLMAAAYRRCDLVADLGPCMAERLARHGAARATATLTPWALVEPPEPVPADATARRALFGDARLALLYPGNFGRAHAHAELLALAGAMRGDGVRLCFAVRGHRAEDLRRAVPADDRSVSFAPFAAEADLERRLGAADVHVASLRPEWAGLVVPSKFFGSLAVGRPVLFAGSPEADVARFIREHGVGFVLDPTSGAQVAAELRVLARDPARLRALQARCHDVYRRHFSRERVVGEWDRRLRQLLPGAAA
jgi:glycosyltransferase involved in cell wall biosynthesis